jgi:hypothetical protein
LGRVFNYLCETIVVNDIDTLINSTNKNIPHKTAKNKNGHPWIDAELKKQIRRQQRLYKKMKKTGDPDIIL